MDLKTLTKSIIGFNNFIYVVHISTNDDMGSHKHISENSKIRNDKYSRNQINKSRF